VERSTDGGLVRTLAGGTLPAGPATFPWDGLDAAGTPVVDGSYAFRAELAAPGGRVATLVVPVGVSAALVAATVTPAAISPNGDGRMDRVVVRASLRSRAATTIRIEDTAGPDSVTLVSGDRPKGVTSATWDGRFGTKAAVGGRYIAVVTVRTATGTFSTRLPFTVDMKGAVATPLAASPVYPIADGYRDTTQLRFRLSEAASGTVTVLRSGSSKVLRSIPFKRAPRGSASVTWDGRDGSGRPATAGTYRFRVTTRDDAGNLRASGDGTVVVSSQRLVSTTVTVTLPGDALDASASRVEGGPGSSVGPVDTFEGGYRLAVTRATDGGEGFGDLVYRAAVPVGTVAVSLTVGVTYTAAGPDPVRIFGFGPAPDEDLVTYGTLALDGSTSSIAVPVSMLPSPSAGDVMLLLVIEGEGTVDVGSITLTYRYGILR
jgi:flagellar hook assembly protein FlgD